jgi:hypothetical protein
MTEQDYKNSLGKTTQSIFFSKDTISDLNKNTLHQLGLNNLSRDVKQELINIIIKNMKMIYKSLDLSKINNTNIKSIYDQFKDHTIRKSIVEIKQLVNNTNFNPSELKFKRDFNSNPNPGNKFLERPKSSTEMFLGSNISCDLGTNRVNLTSNPNKIKYDMNLSNNTPLFNQEISGNNLDQVFKPIVEENNFNNYNSYNNNKNMDSIQKMRQYEIPQKNQKPPTPDFLKSIKSNPNKINQTNTKIEVTNNGKPDFKNLNSNSFNQGFQGLANDIGGDLYSLDNIDKPLVNVELVEDNASFEDRLKKLQSARNNLKPVAQNKVDFSSENFSETYKNNMYAEQHDMKPLNLNTKVLNEQPLQKQEFLNSSPTSIEQQEINSPKKITYTDQPLQQRELLNQNRVVEQSKENIKQNTIENNSLHELITKLTIENNQLKEIINNNEVNKVIELKKQIANEFELLKIKNEELEDKYNQLNLKEINLNKKQNDIQQMITNYNHLFNSNLLQIEVTNSENKSAYIWSMETIPNVMGIKLMSYSLPAPKFNIEQNKNNTLELIVNDNNISIILDTGKYNIDDLIESLNDKLNSHNILLSLNKQQKITLKANNEDDKITIIPTNLSKFNLGFTSKYEGNYNYTADTIWDLRIDDKIYLYLNNLSEDIPFGILYFNGKATSQFKFQQPFSLDKLEILFKDSKGNNVDFYGLPHNLSFLIEK